VMKTMVVWYVTCDEGYGSLVCHLWWRLW